MAALPLRSGTPRVGKPTKGNDDVNYTAEASAANIAVMKLATAVDLVRESEETLFDKYGQPQQDTPEHVLMGNNRAVIRELVISVGELGRILSDLLTSLAERDGAPDAAFQAAGVKGEPETAGAR